MSRTALFITSLAAAFVLVLIGGVVSRMSTAPAPVIAQPAGDASDPAAEPTADPARFEERERAYRARLDQANERLRAQQAALDEARRRLRQAPDVVPVRPSPERREHAEHEGRDEERHHRVEHEGQREHGRYAFAMRGHHDDDED